MYIVLRSFLRSIFKFFGLGLIKNSDLSNIRSRIIEYDNLRVKLKFYLDSLSQSALGSVVSVENLINHSKS